MKLMGEPDLGALGQMIRMMRMDIMPPQTLRSFASRCNISPTYLSFIERGVLRSPPTMSVLSTIAYELDTDCIDLFLLAGRIDKQYYRDVLKARKKHPDWKPFRKQKNRDYHGNYRPDNE